MRAHPDSHPSATSAFSRRSSRTFAAALGTVIVSGALLMPGLATPAFAASACPVGSAAIAAGSSTCEIVFTANGTWTPPAGVSKVEALLVGGGGSSDNYYGGGGGDVKIVELAASGAVTVVVGVGGVLPANAGGGSSVTQGTLVQSAAGGGGRAGSSGGTSGSGKLGISSGGGGGAGAAATDNAAGAGIVVSTLPFPLFATDTSCFGGGGGGGSIFVTAATATCGGGYYTDLIGNTPNGQNGWTANSGSFHKNLPAANSGGGASPVVTFGSASAPYDSAGANGAGGQVALRFTVEVVPEAPVAPPALAVTGAPQSALGILSAALLTLIGAGAIAASRRGRTRRS